MNRSLHIISLLFLIGCSLSVEPQTDFFGNKAPQDQQKKLSNPTINKPNKPNKVDAQGRRQGEWGLKYANGNYAYTAFFVDGKPHGTVTRFAENGKKEAEIIYVEGNDTCKAILYGEKGNIEAKGQYVNEKKVGKWIIYNDKDVVIGNESYVNGEYHGTQFYYFSDGKLRETINYQNGIAHGAWNEFFHNGKKHTEATYKNGKLDGKFTVWNEDTGKIAACGKYADDHQVGKWQMWDEFAKETFFVSFDNNGNMTNPDEVQKRMERKMQYYE